MKWVSPGPAFLFCPADRPDRFAKAAAVADVVIVDLEDGVAPHQREEARANVARANIDPARTIVRINAVTSEDHARDVAMLRASGFDMVMLAKTSSASQVRSLDDFGVFALCETPEGVTAAEEIAECPNTLGLMWGAEDLVVALGGYSSRHDSGSYRDVARYARARILLAAGAVGLCALDAVHLDIDDLEGQREEAQDAAAMGFSASVCIHPSQVDVVRQAYRPTPAQISWAEEILRAADDREGVFRVGGLMVDGPVVSQARQILSRVST
jgi:citrate lyase subunit beta / citryl-CoA lyase